MGVKYEGNKSWTKNCCCFLPRIITKKQKGFTLRRKKRSRKEKEYSEYNMYIYKHISSMEISPLRALFPLLNFILFFFPPSPSTLNIHPKKERKKKSSKRKEKRCKGKDIFIHTHGKDLNCCYYSLAISLEHIVSKNT